MNDKSAGRARAERGMAATGRTSFGGAGFNKFNGAAFDGKAVFHAIETAFGRALKQFPGMVRESCYVLGGDRVRMRIVGVELAEHIVQPFSHLRTDAPAQDAPQLTIDLWDETTTGIRSYTGSSVNGWNDVTSISADGRFVGQLLPNTLGCLDRNARRIVGSIAWSNGIFIYERAKPLARLLLEWHNDRHIQVIHAGLVSLRGQGILFIAKSGSGKSTACLACISAGYNYVGEDFVGIQRLGDGSFVGHSLYNSVFLETGHLARFPKFAPHAIHGRPHEKKSVVVLSHVFPERLERLAPVRAVVLPHLTDASESRIRPASRSQALLAVAPSSLIEIPSRGMDGFARLTQLVEQVPTYSLELGRDLGSIPRCVDRVVAAAGQS